MCIRDRSGGMFSLKTADSAKHMIQMVFITGEIYKFTSQDSAICTHDAACLLYTSIRIFSVLLIVHVCRTNRIPITVLLAVWGLLIGEAAVSYTHLDVYKRQYVYSALR